MDAEKKKTNKTITHTAGAATLTAAALAATEFIPADLSAELIEKVTSGGLTINSIVTAVLVWAIARNRTRTRQLQDKLDELTKDANTPPETNPHTTTDTDNAT